MKLGLNYWGGGRGGALQAVVCLEGGGAALGVADI